MLSCFFLHANESSVFVVSTQYVFVYINPSICDHLKATFRNWKKISFEAAYLSYQSFTMTQINQSILWSRFPVLTFGLDLNEGQCSFFDYMLHCTRRRLRIKTKRRFLRKILLFLIVDIGNIVKNNLSFAFNSNRGLNSVRSCFFFKFKLFYFILDTHKPWACVENDRLAKLNHS